MVLVGGATSTTDKITLVDESVVEVAPPTKTIVQMTPEGTKKILTNNVQNLIKIDKNVEAVIDKTSQTLPTVDFNLIEVAEKEEGNLVNTYTFVVDTDKSKVGDYKHQITVVQNKQTKDIKVVDVEELESKPILDLIKRPVTTIPEAEFQTYQVQNIISTLKDTNPKLKTEELTVKSVTKEDKKFVNKFEIVVATPQGETLTVTANEDLGDHLVKITDVREIIKPSTQERPYIQQVMVDSTTGVKTTVTTNQQEIKKSYITQSVLSEVKSQTIKPVTSEIVSIKTQEYEKTEKSTVLIETSKPQQYLQVVYEKPKDSSTVVYVSEEIVSIEENRPLIPVTQTQVIRENKFTQVIKTDPVLQTVTQQVIAVQPTFQNIRPVETEITECGDIKDIVMVFEPKDQPKQRVYVQYDKMTEQVIVKETTSLPVKIPQVFVEKDIISETSVKITSNTVE